ncbi:MAG: hypothetical protein DMF64_03425 [Acidobacteria bacterium]|nr:MAG: hypothetical protein DMF64_03425 [Acidobacteriota bacterium]
MNTAQRLTLAPLALALAFVIATAAPFGNFSLTNDDAPATTAQQPAALERGYRTGYSDGYQAGWRDQVEHAARDYRSKSDYQHADRVYNTAYGSLEDYRDGYQQGFEIGYSAGFEQRGFDSAAPASLTRRGVQHVAASDSNDRHGASDSTDRRSTSDASDSRSASDSTNRSGGATADLSGTIDIPRDTDLRVELQTRLSTDVSQHGDRFDARVVGPAQLVGAIVSGRVSRVRRPGKVKGTAELQLDIEQIRLPDGRFANLNAQVVEVSRRTNTGVGDVDPEGGVRGGDKTKDDVTKVGAGAGIGAVIGAIAGGGRGAAIGAVIGAGVGTAGVLTSRGSDIRLEPGTELVLRTSTDTRIQ